MRFFFIVNVNRKEAIKRTKLAVNIIKELGGEYAIENSNSIAFGKEFEFDSVFHISSYNFIIAVGGDGTIMAAAKYAFEYNLPVLGINAGRMGFLCGLEGHDLKNLEKIFNGDYNEEKRTLLEIEWNDKKTIAVNDAVFVKPVLGSIIDLKVFESDNFVIEYRADSVLFSTPTGSTAYALSNGGPVADPNLKFISMSPICSHSLISRAYLFSDNAEIKADVGKSNKAYLIVDGKKMDLLEKGTEVKIRKSDRWLRLVYLEDIPFFELLRKKFFPS
ncbi:MAG: NAD(+)/NADH kinase [Oscillospiraceae bacterium]|nr:NAD(+)/NADH kinase [Oscillospiraceae bacterium]